MKRTKRFATLLLALVMILCLSVPAFADGTTGSITIKNAVDGQTYSVYRILALSYDQTNNAYAYTIANGWAAFFAEGGAGHDYVNVDGQGYVTWNTAKDSAEDRATFAKAAKAYATANSSTIETPKRAEADSTTVTFTDLPLGYYLVDSTLGTLCSLDTTNPDVDIEEKNAAPANTKTVEEDSTGNYGETNDADIGQTVSFKSTITAQAGAENYVFHDKMSVGLTFGSVTGITLGDDAVAAENYTIKTGPFSDGCTFEVEFTQEFCDTLKANDKIIISYTATLNENAVIGGDGNPNESKISYGDSSNIKTTPGSTTTTYTWSFGVFKYTVSGENQKALAGAKFTLSKNKEGTNPIELISKGGNVYRVAKEGDENTITEITTDATGKFTIEGLDSDTYYLTETEAPAGYNKLANSIEVKVENGTLAANKTVNVENKTGTELPSTGGIGTTIFYVLGGVLAVGAAVLLATKKRMDKSEG